MNEPAAVELRSVTRTFAGGRRALDDVSFSVAEGALLALLGTSGSGKTTALRSINRLVTPDSGTVLVGGVDVSTIDPVKLRRGIGYVIQEVGLLPHLSVGDNVDLVPRLLDWPPRSGARDAASCSTSWACRQPSSRRGGPPSSRAASASASAWRAPWPPIHRCC